MTIKEGDTLPEVTLHHMTEKGPTPITSSELFGGKKTVLFAVPGAFTPGCSMQHLPGFVTNSQEILDKGADQIVCLSVNDKGLPIYKDEGHMRPYFVKERMNILDFYILRSN